MSRTPYTLTVEYEYVLEEENVPIRGNAIASGDEAYDREVEDRILRDLHRGNLHAWCVAHVTAMLQFQESKFLNRFSVGNAYVGACSYYSEEELWEDLGGDLEADARKEAEAEMRRVLLNEVNGVTRTDVAKRRESRKELEAFEVLMADLNRSESLRRLLARQKRAERILASGSDEGSRWARNELVAVDQALEKL